MKHKFLSSLALSCLMMLSMSVHAVSPGYEYENRDVEISNPTLEEPNVLQQDLNSTAIEGKDAESSTENTIVYYTDGTSEEYNIVGELWSSNSIRNRKDIKSIVIGYHVTSIGWCAFNGCTGLASITIPNSVNSIGHEAFARCNNLKEVVLLDGITNIDKEAFANCTGLTSITIPNSVTSIGAYAFFLCM